MTLAQAVGWLRPHLWRNVVLTPRRPGRGFFFCLLITSLKATPHICVVGETLIAGHGWVLSNAGAM